MPLSCSVRVGYHDTSERWCPNWPEPKADSCSGLSDGPLWNISHSELGGKMPYGQGRWDDRLDRQREHSGPTNS